MADTCTHLDSITDVTPSSSGCEGCERIGGRWVHLRLCIACGHVGCCDNSLSRHATAHWHEGHDHPLIRSYEPGEDWWWCAARTNCSSGSTTHHRLHHTPDRRSTP